MLEVFKTNITPAQAMKLFTVPKDMRRTWPEHGMHLAAILEACGGGADNLVLNNIVQYASVDLRMVLMAKVDGSRLDYLQQVEKLAQFAQYWELEPAKRRNLGKKGVSAGGECSTKEMRTCHECNQVGHLRAACPGRGRSRRDAPDLTLVANKRLPDVVVAWIFNSGSSRHLVSDASLLDDVRACDGMQTVKLTDMYYTEGVVHNLISYGKLNEKGYTLTHKGGRRVVAPRTVGV
ncbi:hypothetical protein PI124_g16094 [Phytophthora idaei]|nr:hypothetical protein PI125_g15244 [Phytophthora idaei]KAG3144467.1 hypothetical protein PI126_g14151 [Phytophthora idaei]KAG3238957.1 hypothetical protein PI124_g16094 [Phytophthora idaei]